MEREFFIHVMTYKLLSEMADRIAGAGVVVTTLPERVETWPKPSRPVPILIMLGTADPLMPWNGTRGQQSAQATIDYWKNVNGCTGEGVKKEFPDKDPNDGCRVRSERWEGKAPVLFYTLEGHGHGCRCRAGFAVAGHRTRRRATSPHRKNTGSSFNRLPSPLPPSQRRKDEDDHCRHRSSVRQLCALCATKWRTCRTLQATRPQRRWQDLTRGSRFVPVLPGGGQRWQWFPDFRGGGGACAAERGPAHNRTAGMEGDGAGPMTSRVKPVEIPETDSPIRTLDAKAADGRTVQAFWRKPKGDGPFPAIVFIHGGLTQFPEEVLRRQLTVNPVVTRMLAAGYAVVQATFRTYEQDVQSRGPIEDVRAVVRALAETPGIDGSASRSLAAAVAAASRWNSAATRQCAPSSPENRPRFSTPAC